MYDNFIFLDFFLLAYLGLIILSGLFIYSSVIKKAVKDPTKKRQNYQTLEFGEDNNSYLPNYDFEKRKWKK